LGTIARVQSARGRRGSLTTSYSSSPDSAAALGVSRSRGWGDLARGTNESMATMLQNVTKLRRNDVCPKSQVAADEAVNNPRSGRMCCTACIPGLARVDRAFPSCAKTNPPRRAASGPVLRSPGRKCSILFPWREVESTKRSHGHSERHPASGPSDERILIADRSRVLKSAVDNNRPQHRRRNATPALHLHLFLSPLK